MKLDLKSSLKTPHGHPPLTNQPAVYATTAQTRPHAPNGTPPPPGRSVVVVPPLLPPDHVPGQGRDYIESPLKKILLGLNARAMSPREMQVLSEDLYASGVLTWEEYSELAFQADLHPDFKRTIGALTGERPTPDRPKDFVKEWEARLDYERRHFPEGPERDRALRILSVLRRINAPTDMKT